MKVISDLTVRIYGDSAIAGYKSTYDSVDHGEQRARTILSTDSFIRQDSSWKQVASPSSELAKQNQRPHAPQIKRVRRGPS